MSIGKFVNPQKINIKKKKKKNLIYDSLNNCSWTCNNINHQLKFFTDIKWKKS